MAWRNERGSSHLEILCYIQNIGFEFKYGVLDLVLEYGVMEEILGEE